MGSSPPLARPGRSSRVRSALTLSGLAVAVGLVCVGLFGFQDAGALAQVQLEREARAASRAAALSWSSGVGKALLPPEVGTRLHLSSEPVRVAQPTEPVGDLLQSRAALLAARTAAASGDRAATLEALSRLQDDFFPLPAEALLVTVHARRAVDALEGLPNAWRFIAASAPFDRARDSVPLRLLAVLAAGTDLPVELRDAEAVALRRALGSGELALPEPVDRVHFGPDGIQVALDPTWTALRSLLDERAPRGGDRTWATAFDEDGRRSQAPLQRLIARGLEIDQLESRDRFEQLGDDLWLVAHRDLGFVRVATRTGAQIDAALAAHLPPLEGGLVVSVFGPPAGEALATPRRLGDLPRPLVVSHPDLGRLRREATLRQRLLRGGLGLVAVLVALATLLATRAWRRADELAVLRSTFVASVSHDLRTPITSIGLLAETLRDGHAAGKEPVYLESIERETGRLRRLVDDLLDFGRLERGLRLHLRPEDTALEPWLRDFVERERARCQETGATLALELGAVPGRAHVDVDAVERALSNLVDNALRHGAARRITLAVGAGPDGTLEFGLHDDGRGLARAKLNEQLFEPFERGGAASAGTGLGLAIVRAIAEAHGGGASIAPGRSGAGVSVRLRIVPGPASADGAGEGAA